MSAQSVGLAFAYTLHLFATVIWLGGLAAISLFVIPAARKTLAISDYSRLFAAVQKKLQQLGWFSLAVLIFSGMFQMSAHPNYQGVLAITNSWSLAILIKHLVVGVMIVLSAYSTWVLTPALQRLALKQGAGKEVDPAALASLRKREALLIRANMVISLVVLVLTAVARAS